MALFDLYNLQNNVYGDFLIPWVFVFALIYGLLQMSGVFKGKQAVEILLSITIAFFTVATSSFRAFLWNIMPWAAGILIALAFLKIVLNLTGISKISSPGDWGKFINVGTFGLLFIFLGTIQNKFSNPYFDWNEVIWAVGLGALAVLMYKVVTEMETASNSKQAPK